MRELYTCCILLSGSDLAIWSSDNGDRIAYLSFNDSEVEQVTLQHFDNIESETNDQPDQKILRYPKVKLYF